MAPRHWKRPLTSIYNENYKYGNSLYAGTIDDIEKRYQNSVRRTSFRSDRGDTGLTAFASSSIGSAASKIGSGHGSEGTLRAESTPVPTPMPSQAPLQSVLEGDLDLQFQRRPQSALLDVGKFRRPFHASSSFSDDEELSRLDEESFGTRRRKIMQDRSYFGLGVAPTAAPTAAAAAVAAPAAVTTSASATADYYYEKCRELKKELDTLQLRVMDAETRAKSDSSAIRSRVQTEIAELRLYMEDTTAQSNELQKVLKKQAKQLLDLQSYCNELQRHLQEAAEELSSANKRCGDLQREIDTLQSSMETTICQV